MKPVHKTAIASIVFACCLWATTNFEGNKHTPYRDLGGVWTVCKGHTGPDVIPGKVWTDEQCEVQDRADIETAAAAVDSCVSVHLTTGQQIAFNDFAYNVGAHAFCVSSMARLANESKVKESCEPILKYVYVGKINCRTAGKACPGVVRRREWEYQKCLS